MSDEAVSTPAAPEEVVADGADNVPVTEDTTAPPEATEDASAPPEPENAEAKAEPKKKKRTAKPKVIQEPKSLKKSGHPKTADMIIYAIESLGERKGSSVQAIKNFILKTYPSVKEKKIKWMLKTSLSACIDDGTIKRPDGQEDAKTLVGRYKVVKAAQSTNPTSEEMVVAAVGAINEPKGATALAIKSYIADNYEHVRPEMIRHQVRLGLKKAMAKGSVAPTKAGSDGKVSLKSRWRLQGKAKKEIQMEKKKKREAEAAKEAANKKAAAAREAAKKKSLASKKASPKKPAAKKAASKKPAAKKAAPKKPAAKKAAPKKPAAKKAAPKEPEAKKSVKRGAPKKRV